MAEIPLVRIVHRLRRLTSTPDTREKSDACLLSEFKTGHDQAAFAALVERHGSMVLGVCRKVLRQEQDAEDAFQATFVVLARRAGSLTRPGSLAGWLYGVAYRVAIQARRNAALRKEHEARAAPPVPAEPRLLLAWQEVQAILAEEIQYLPERLRSPFVLCVVQGRGRAEVARLLELKEGTVWSRLAHARKRLRIRLVRRGIELGAVLAASYVASESSQAAVPTGLLDRTTLQAVAAAKNGCRLSPELEALARRGLGPASASRVRVGLVLLMASILGTITATLARQAPPASTTQKNLTVAAAQLEAEPAAGTAERGHVDRYDDPLPDEAITRLGTTRFRSGPSVLRTQFTADGKQLIVGSSGAGVSRGGLGVWDVATGRKIRDFAMKPESLALQAVLSPDGKVLATGEFDEVQLWDVTTGANSGKLKTGFVGSLAFSPDGNILAVGSDTDVALWEIPSRKLIRRLTHDAYVRAVAFTLDGKYLVTGATDKFARQWDPATGKEVRRWQAASGPSVSGHHALRAEPAGPRVIYADDETIRFLDTSNGSEKLIAGPDSIQRAALAISRDGKTLASGHADGSIHLWDASTGKEISHWQTSGEMILTVTFSPDGKTLVSGDYRGSSVRSWDTASGKELPQKWAGHNGYVKSIRYSADGKDLYSIGADSSFYRWDVRSGVAKESCTWPMSADAKCTPDGTEILSSEFVDKVAFSAPRILRFRETAHGSLLRTQAGPAITFLIAFSSDSKLFATAGADKTEIEVSVWDSKTGKRLHQFSEPGMRGYFDLVFSPDGKKLAAGTWNSTGVNFHLWDLQMGKKIASCAPDHWVNSIAFSPDGQLVALASGGDWKKCVSIWDLPNASMKYKFVVPTTTNDLVVAFSPTGRFLATAGSALYNGFSERSGQNDVYVLETATGQQVGKFPGNHSGVTALAFAPDCQTLASGGGDSTILLWDLIGRRHRAKGDAKPLTPDELDNHWKELAGEDASAAYAAIAAFVLEGDRAVNHLKTHLSAVPRVTAAETKRALQLAADLDSPTFDVRQKAADELGKMPVAAPPVLRKCLDKSPGAEVRRRIESLLSEFDSKATAQRLLTSRALEVLEAIGSQQAHNLVKELASGEPTAGLTRDAGAALERLERRAN
jgi:RNA polymerase sigma factor (sigma-70 family)